MTHILIAEPDSATGKALSLFLQRKISSVITTEVRDVETLIRTVADTPPDALILNWNLHGSPAPELCHLLRKAYPSLKIILMSTHADHRFAASALGIDFVYMGAQPDELLVLLQAVV
jgi:DNA-binding NarL/FixJ family response regulator